MALTPDWLLDCKPREVQLEALRRSYLGLATKEAADGRTDVRYLHHYGQPAVSWGHFLEMRLGKTATLLNEFMLLKRDGAVKRALILSPNSFKSGWAKEAHALGVDVPVRVFDSAHRKKAAAFAAANKYGIMVVHYEAGTNEGDFRMFSDWVDGQLIAADESVKLKNPSGQHFKRAYMLAEQAKYRRALTGLPAPQSVADLWSQFRFMGIMKDLNYYAFRARFATMGGYMGKQVKGVKNEHILRRVFDANTFVATRKQWGGYTEAEYMTLALEMTPAQRKAYGDMEADFVTWLDGDDFVTADQAITKYVKLQQISSGFIADEQGKARTVEPFSKTPKFKAVVEALEDYVPGKLLIIAKYSHTIDELLLGLAKYNPAVIRGAAHMRAAGLDVMAEKERFNNDPGCRVLVGQQTATKYGHTLTGTPEYPCKTIVFYENSYSLDDRAQVEERPQGFTQHGPTLIIDFEASKVEGEIVKALQRKQKVSDVIMGHYSKVVALTSS